MLIYRHSVTSSAEFAVNCACFVCRVKDAITARPCQSMPYTSLLYVAAGNRPMFVQLRTAHGPLYQLIG
jgi:hypothetical protein